MPSGVYEREYTDIGYRYVNRQPEPEDIKWMDNAACRGLSPELFFTSRGDWIDQRKAKAICATCSVQRACLDYAMKYNETRGIWGGKSERQRREMRTKHLRMVHG